MTHIVKKIKRTQVSLNLMFVVLCTIFISGDVNGASLELRIPTSPVYLTEGDSAEIPFDTVYKKRKPRLKYNVLSSLPGTATASAEKIYITPEVGTRNTSYTVTLEASEIRPRNGKPIEAALSFEVRIRDSQIIETIVVDVTQPGSSLVDARFTTTSDVVGDLELRKIEASNLPEIKSYLTRISSVFQVVNAPEGLRVLIPTDYFGDYVKDECIPIYAQHYNTFGLHGVKPRWQRYAMLDRVTLDGQQYFQSKNYSKLVHPTFIGKQCVAAE